MCENFDDMSLKEELLRGIYAYGFEKPSAIQQRAIVPCIKVCALRICIDGQKITLFVHCNNNLG